MNQNKVNLLAFIVIIVLLTFAFWDQIKNKLKTLVIAGAIVAIILKIGPKIAQAIENGGGSGE